MFQHRPILKFFVILLVAYGALIAPWPGLDAAYLAFFRTTGNIVFHSIGPAGAVRFENQPPQGDNWATKITLRNKRTGAEGRIDRCSARHGYRMAALVAALIIATPLPLRRRCLALFWGLLIANAILLFTTWLGFVDVFSAEGPLRQFTLSPFTTKVLLLAVRILTLSPEVPFAVPVFIWIAVAIRRQDLQRWLSALAANPSGDDPRPRH